MSYKETITQQLIGRWSLESHEDHRDPNSPIIIATHQNGSLEYTSDGQVRVSIQRDEEHLKTRGLNPRLANLQYSGRYEIDPEKSLVFHLLETANEPTRIGQTLTRHFRLQKDRLELSGIGLESPVKLIWKKTP